jgi:hypothetical protein
MKGHLTGALKTAAALFITATLGFAQGNMSAPGSYAPGPSAVTYGHSQAPARHQQGTPGTINYVEGQASLAGQPLGPNAAGYAVAEPNQAIDTQAGYVEVLLTPGAFLRIGHNSEVVLQSVGLANVQIQIVRGSAMVEATDLVKDTVMQVSMGGASTQIEKRGLYQFDANQQLVRVLDGKAKVLEADNVKNVDKGDQLVLTAEKLKTHGFDKKVAEADPLYVWSSARSEAEAKANVQLASNIAVYGGWNGPGWYWNPFWADYAFLPAYGYLYSPFGWGFYAPGFVYAAPLYRGGYFGRGYYGRVGGVAAYHGFAGRAAFAGGDFTAADFMAAADTDNTSKQLLSR